MKIIFIITIIGILLIANPSFAITTEFRITGTNENEAYTYADTDAPPPPTSGYFGTKFSDYSAIASSDNSRASYIAGAYKYSTHTFRFFVNITPSDISSMTVNWEGYSSQTGVNLYIMNFTDNAWVLLGSHTDTAADQTITSTITSPTDISRYISSGGELHLAAESQGAEPAGSCPFVYSWNGSKYEYESDFITENIVTKKMEDYSYHRLKYLEPEDSYKIRITEELYEISYLDYIDLRVVDHKSKEIMPDYDGNIYTLDDIQKPIKCVDKWNNDCLSLIEKSDDIHWEAKPVSDDFNDEENLRTYMEVTLPEIPNDAKLVKVIVHGKKTDFIEFQGRLTWKAFPEWFWSLFLEKIPILSDLFTNMWKETMKNVFVLQIWDGEKWINKETLLLGPLYDTEILIPINKEEMKSNKIRIEGVSYSFLIDYIGVDYTPEREVSITKIPTTNKEMSKDDDNYFALNYTEYIDLEFPLVEEREGYNRSYVFASKGYYYPFYESGTEFRLDSMMAFMGGGMKYFLNEYLKYKESESRTIYTDTVNITVVWSTPGKLIVNLTYPPTTGVTTVGQTQKWFWVNATVNCTVGYCGGVNAILRYNSTSSNPDTNVPTGFGQPFWVSTNPLTTCGFMGKDENCTVGFQVNLYNREGYGYKLGILFASDEPSVAQNHTGNATVSIYNATPTYSKNAINTTIVGQPCEFKLEWNDNIGLSMYKFSTNNTGTWENASWVSFSITPQNATNVTILNSTIGTVVAWCFYANDSSSNMNATNCEPTNRFHLTTTEGIPPTYSDNSTNDTTAGKPVRMNLKWTDNFNMSGYEFYFVNGTVKTLGTTTPYGSYYGYANYILGNTYTASENGKPISMSGFIKSTVANKHIKFAIYSVSDWKLVAYTEEYTTTGTENGWITLDVVWRKDLVGGVDYDLVWWSDDGNIQIGYTSSDYVYDSVTYSGNWPDPWNRNTWTDREKYSLYVTYAPLVKDEWIEFKNVMCPTPKSECWSNVTKVVNNTEGVPIYWWVRANDTSNNWNTSEIFSFLTTPAPSLPQCNDGKDNDSDGKTDSADPGCHTDGNAANPASYDPNDNDETDVLPPTLFPPQEDIPKYFLGFGFDVNLSNINNWYIWEKPWNVTQLPPNRVNISNSSEYHVVEEGGNFSLRAEDGNYYFFKVRNISSDRTDIQPLNKSFYFKDFTVDDPNKGRGKVNIIAYPPDNHAAMTSNGSAIWISNFPTLSDEYRTLVKAAIASRADEWTAKRVFTTKETTTVSSFYSLCCDMPETAELEFTLWYIV